MHVFIHIMHDSAYERAAAVGRAGHMAILLEHGKRCQIVIQNYFQSVGKPKISIFLSLTRQLLFLIPFLIILPKQFGIDGVWASIAVSDLIAFVFAIVTLWWQMKKHNQAISTP